MVSHRLYLVRLRDYARRDGLSHCGSAVCECPLSAFTHSSVGIAANRALVVTAPKTPKPPAVGYCELGHDGGCAGCNRSRHNLRLSAVARSDPASISTARAAIHPVSELSGLVGSNAVPRD